MKKNIFFSLFRIFVICLLFVCIHISDTSGVFAGDSSKQAATDDAWVTMPAGGKPAYMGIHGGTMPVSLLVSHDGSSLLSFVGRTGNDFLEVLHSAYTSLPSFGNATRRNAGNVDLSRTATGIFAGNATNTMPVISLSGDVLSNPTLLERLQPFGLSDEPLVIEGQVAMPKSLSPVKKYRNFLLPNYFKPEKPTR